MITIFTPTYNRAYCLTRLYQSLCVQTYTDFEWLIIDDGSTDHTSELIAKFRNEKQIHIHYIYCRNGGKHRAINKGVQLAKGELFFIVDSDDYLGQDAIERVCYHYSQIKDDDSFAGVCGMKILSDGNRVGGNVGFTIIDCTLVDFRYKHKVMGDLADVYRTDILRQYPFPEIDGENFCPETLVWCKIATKYKIRFFNEPIYICEYLQDGLTANSFRVRKNNPIASMLAYREIYKSKVPCKIKIKALISYWRFYFHSSIPFREAATQMGISSMIFLLLGYGIYLADKKRK